MSKENVAVGFRNVDKTGNENVYSRCLSTLDSLPYYVAIKRQSYERLKLMPNDNVLDAGCGIGDDVFRMAEKVSDGSVVGMDSSVAMLKEAWADKRSSELPVQFIHGDIKTIPFGEGYFSKCRIDRVLQHVPQPREAIKELVRVLEPGGLLLAYDNDWGSFSVNSDDMELTRIIENLWTGSLTNTWIGRYLTTYFVDAGLRDVIAYPSVSLITDFETADKIYFLRQTVERAVSEKLITEKVGQSWISELAKKTERGCFAASLTAYTVVGRKPQ
ncbi:methyltransferase domain-containing protein [Rubellicoccus peritrichatus]|uniref:Methyltransferase domain-containing protein n=1 Tax=Rubellicoccus peritrichatus TaxID=3080537 RepID=A0AAQ3LDL3_9BACT|nr:methyltransferase domain-containing protein [Puniceicoccus sp. CR14]WOO41623.1 methyltransferase domain-containing protein [Puniceicoccus sp. CR14]